MLRLREKPEIIWNRYNFPFSMENVVLYLPLWQEDMQAATLLSYDQYHHSCAVTGATRGATGRTFDGVDDKIVALTAQYTFPITMMCWVNPTETNTKVFVSHDSGANDGFRLGQVAATDLLQFTLGNVASYNFATLGAIPFGSFSFTAVTVDADNGTAVGYLNEASESQAIGTMGGTPDRIQIATSAAGVGWFKGIIGEVTIVNAVLSAAAISQYRLVTKGRYS